MASFMNRIVSGSNAPALFFQPIEYDDDERTKAALKNAVEFTMETSGATLSVQVHKFLGLK